jgi:hypothetical protein
MARVWRIGDPAGPPNSIQHKSLRVTPAMAAGVSDRLWTLRNWWIKLQTKGRTMGAFSVWHLIILALVLFLLIYPISRILRRIGWSPWLSLLWLIPLLNVVMLWLVAFARWPAVPENSN